MDFQQVKQDKFSFNNIFFRRSPRSVACRLGSSNLMVNPPLEARYEFVNRGYERDSKKHVLNKVTDPSQTLEVTRTNTYGEWKRWSITWVPNEILFATVDAGKKADNAKKRETKKDGKFAFRIQPSVRMSTLNPLIYCRKGDFMTATGCVIQIADRL